MPEFKTSNGDGISEGICVLGSKTSKGVFSSSHSSPGVVLTVFLLFKCFWGSLCGSTEYQSDAMYFPSKSAEADPSFSTSADRKQVYLCVIRSAHGLSRKQMAGSSSLN